MQMSVATQPRQTVRALRLRLAVRNRTWQTIFASLLYFALACHVTWPVALHPSTQVYGPIGADLTGSMAYFHALAAGHTPPFLPGTVHVFNAPEGRPTQWALDFSTLPSSTLLWLGSMAIGSVATFAYWPIFTFTLSALSMFLFVRWLTGSWLAGLVTGFAFGFWGFVFNGMNQPLGNEWPIVLGVWRMLVAIERPSTRNGLLAGAAVAFALWWVQYFILIVGVTWVVLAILSLAVGWIRGQLASAFRTQLVAAVPILLLLAAIALAGLSTSFAGAPTRSSSEVITYSARPLMYLLPAPTNPYTGSLSKPIIDREYFSAHSTATYSEIYVGISVILLAIAGAVVLAREIKRRGWRDALGQRALLAAALLVVAAFVALLFSAPPRVLIFGVDVPMPIELVNHVTTVFRTTARFAVIVMLGLCVLAGLALSRLFFRLRPPVALVVCAVLSFIVVADVWARTVYPISFVIIPPTLRQLAEQPAGAYAEYPFIDGYDFGGDSLMAFLQAYAGDHDLFEGYFGGSAAELRKSELQFLLAPRTLPDLAGMGVRYLLVLNLPAGTPPPMYPRFGAAIPGAQLLSADTYEALYRITARPRALTSFDSVGFSLPEGRGPEYWRWMTANDGEIEIISRLPRPVLAHVSFAAVSAFQPRRLVIRAGGRIVYSGTVSIRAAPIAFTVPLRGKTTLRLHVTPSGQSLHSVDPANPDTRPLAIQVSGPLTIVADGQRH
jgi:hypothetical protein